MLLECAKLRHWQVEKQFRELFTFERDYRKWINLQYEDPSTIGPLEPEWNDFDRLTEQTKMVHNTRRKTQPWKSGLPVDFIPAETNRLFPPIGWLMRAGASCSATTACSAATSPIPTATRRTCSSGCCASASSRAA